MTEPTTDEINEALMSAYEEDEKGRLGYRTFPMEMSDSIGLLADALATAQGQMDNVDKDSQGYGYRYASLGSLIDIARKPLSDNGIAVMQDHELIKGEAPSVVTHTRIMHSSGEYIFTSLELPIHTMPQLSAAQMVGVAATYGRRYALQAICLIAAEEDTDGTIK